MNYILNPSRNQCLCPLPQDPVYQICIWSQRVCNAQFNTERMKHQALGQRPCFLKESTFISKRKSQPGKPVEWPYKMAILLCLEDTPPPIHYNLSLPAAEIPWDVMKSLPALKKTTIFGNFFLHTDLRRVTYFVRKQHYNKDSIVSYSFHLTGDGWGFCNLLGPKRAEIRCQIKARSEICSCYNQLPFLGSVQGSEGPASDPSCFSNL